MSETGMDILHEVSSKYQEIRKLVRFLDLLLPDV